MMNTFAFTLVDIAAIGILALSAVLGLVRGLVRELLSLLGFGFSMWVAYRFSHQVVGIEWLAKLPGGELGRLGLAFVALFIISWLGTRILGALIAKMISSAGLSVVDRILGAFFGVARGALLVVVLSTLGALTSLPQSHDWKDALTRPAIEESVSIVRSWMPADWAKRVSDASDIRQR